MARQSSRLVSAFVETGQVIDVDIENYTLSVVTQFTQKAMNGISFATPYQHYANGEGIYFMPEVGSLCWVCFPSDGGNPFVLAFAPAVEENGSLRSRKMGLNPGDIYLGTRDENFLILRRGGVVQIGGGPLCQRMFIPVNNIIRDFCENYGLHTPGGDLEWTVDREETTTDGHRPTRLRLKAREFADDEEPVAVLEIGSHTGNPANILSLVVNASGAKGAAKKISLEFRKDGTADFTFDGDVNWTVTENLSIQAKNLSLSAEQLALLEGANVKISGKTGNVELTAAQLISLMAGSQVTLGPRVSAGPPEGAEFPVMLATPDWLAWLLSHVHPVIAVGSPSGPPIPTTSQTHISKTLFGK